MTTSLCNLTSQMQLASFLGLSTVQFLIGNPSIVLPVSDQKLDCGKA